MKYNFWDESFLIATGNIEKFLTDRCKSRLYTTEFGGDKMNMDQIFYHITTLASSVI